LVIARCKECGKEYELMEDENPEDFQCECGGDLNIEESFDRLNNDFEEIKFSCPNCGAEIPEDSKICKSCHKVLKFSSHPKKEPITSKPLKTYENPDYFDFWTKQKSNYKIGSIIGIFVIVGLLGVFVVFPWYTSMMYDYHLTNANNAIVDAKSAISQVEPLQKPTDENIQLTNESMRHIDKAIVEFKAMYDNAPDNVTKRYAELRLKQYTDLRRWQQLAIRGYEEIKSSGTIEGGLIFMASSGDEINNIKTNIASYQNEIILLTQNNPDLQKRLVNVMGQEKTQKGLQPYNPSEGSVPI